MNERARELLQERRVICAKETRLTSEERSRLKVIGKELNELDPHFHAPINDPPELTAEQIEEQNRIVEDILKEIREEEK